MLFFIIEIIKIKIKHLEKFVPRYICLKPFTLLSKQQEQERFNKCYLQSK